ncbi:hypothetical protein [Mulberry dwarf phytoplasma]|uniref:hypothetical protein n=1 Tax=Mulberry dwarf phytoplasma TaxID=186171 RepID=UPI001D130232|nr:hypothetical protein [Mulberry dwarf phytoplasma]
MNELNFAIGFIVGALFTTALMFIIKKIFFNFVPEINQKNETQKESKPKKSFSIIPTPNNESKEKNNLESNKEINN